MVDLTQKHFWIDIVALSRMQAIICTYVVFFLCVCVCVFLKMLILEHVDKQFMMEIFKILSGDLPEWDVLMCLPWQLFNGAVVCLP